MMLFWPLLIPAGTLSLGRGQQLLSFFLSYSGIFLPTHCSSRGLLFHLITLRHTTVGRTPLDEGSARRKYLYMTNTTLTTDIKASRGIRASNPSKQRPQTHALYLMA